MTGVSVSITLTRRFRLTLFALVVRFSFAVVVVVYPAVPTGCSDKAKISLGCAWRVAREMGNLHLAMTQGMRKCRIPCLAMRFCIEGTIH